MTTLEQTDTLPVPREALAAIDALEAAGFEAWLVGGFVRDSLLGSRPKDIDIASSAPWQQARDVFAAQGWKTRESGTKHGTLTVVIGETSFEVTTFRADGPYRDARRPDSVTFVRSLDEDLARRDFTINAIAFHPRRGIHDPFGGIDDLQAGIIRAVGDPGRRFGEDALRILRACRLVAQLGFALDPATYRAMCASKGLLGLISSERILQELRRLILAPFAGKALLETVDVLSAVLPELVAMKGFDQRTPYHVYDVLEHTARVVDGVPPYELVRWAALFHDMGKPATYFLGEDGRGHFYGHGRVGAGMARGAMERLGMSRAFQGRVVDLVIHHDDMVEPTRASVRRMLVKLGGDVELARALFELKRSDALAQAPSCARNAEGAEAMLAILDGIVAEDAAFSVRDLSIGGREVMALGVPEGPLVGQALAAALDAVVEERVENEAAALTRFVEDWLESAARGIS